MLQVPVKVLASCARDLLLLSETKLIDQIQSREMSVWLKSRSKSIQELQETLDMMKDLCEGDMAIMNMSFQKMEASVVGTEGSTSLGKKISVAVTSSSSSSSKSIPEEAENPGVSIELGTLDIIREMIADFSNWVVKFLSDYAQLSSHAEGLSGIVYISPEIEQHTQETFNSNLRKQFMSGLLEPTKFLKTTPTPLESIPDVCYLSDKVKYGQPMEIAHGWMEYFQSKTETRKWDIGNLPSKSKKRPRGKATEVEGLDEQAGEILGQTILKGRFVNAVYDLEKSGIISSRKIDRGDIVIAKQIYTGI